ncbi:phosphoenolpyruvate--protein phosphotransferase [Pseudonocardia charpentierae]|uniref:Phosphoenolpyruvate-protein phosphotransferase n=1 Tax=Pseudonocardia charpentierae TaxID=3075545 RepID=A0ABU2NGY8_9PSEU|nr:phosphoenolpyruvate--protein phosphotransferase [Pseudonocardia sp. DSM 45834]MDT0352283.1 phosphoenolpyruvate--protein phosphotransferase [Pseudonocardia sp. DSM 45834]
MTLLNGIGVCPGIAVGPLVRMPDPVPEPSAGPGQVTDKNAERSRISPAMEAVAAELRARAEKAKAETRAVLEATSYMAVDPGMMDLAITGVVERNLSAARAVFEAANTFRDMLAAAGGYIGARVADIEDVRDRIVAAVLGVPMPGIPDPGHPFILVARDLAPADTATVDPEKVLGFVTTEGGPTSHTAILARTLGVPAVVATEGALSLKEGTTVVLDGGAGTLNAAPTDAEVQDAEKRMAARRGAKKTWSGEGATSDGRRILLLANVGDPKSAKAGADAGAEGVGLFRTEFLFLDSAKEPTVAEQEEAYAGVFAAFPDGRKVVVRTLDAGADKPLAFLDQGEEPNPALGVRGVRVAFEDSGILDRQLQAISRAAERSSSDVWVMAPMIALASEAEWFSGKVREHGLKTPGVMVEVPAAALNAEQILGVTEFASIGTNDLAQYTLAADRMAGPLAALNDPWQPALLKLIGFTGEAGEKRGKTVGVCGEAASDPVLAVVLVGLGVTSLSMSSRALADVGELLRTVSYDDCKRLAQVALDAGEAQAAKAAVRAELPQLDELGL